MRTSQTDCEKEEESTVRILVLSPVDLRNAAHNRLHDFVNHLSRRHRIDVVCTYAWWLEKYDQIQRREDHQAKGLDPPMTGISCEYLGSFGERPVRQELLSFTRARRILDRFQPGEYDLLFNYNTILSGLSIAQSLGETPMVYDLADDIAGMAANSPMVATAFRPMVRPFSRLAISSSIRKSRRVTVATPELARTYDIPSCRTTVIPNGVDPDLFRPHDKEKSKRRFSLDGKIVIGYVGVLREWIDFDMMLGALVFLAKEFPSIRMLVVGGEGRLQELRNMSARMRLEDRVVTPGNLPYGEIPHAMSAMDIGVIPFRLNEVTRNALPLKLFEYMACGVPVISQRLKPVIDSVDENVMYASNGEEMAHAAKEILESNALRKELSENGRKIVQSSWRWETIVRKLESVLEEAVGVSA